MTDILLCQTDDNGEITVVNGSLAMTNGFETAVYLSLFGGNEDDPGESDLTNQYWGNSIETDPNKQYRSRTQYTLRSLPQTSANLNKLKQAVEYDLAWAVSDGLFSEFEVFIGVPRLNWASIEVRTTEGTIRYEVPWEASP